jgi:hypothetical protein
MRMTTRTIQPGSVAKSWNLCTEKVSYLTDTREKYICTLCCRKLSAEVEDQAEHVETNLSALQVLCKKLRFQYTKVLGRKHKATHNFVIPRAETTFGWGRGSGVGETC